MNADSFFSIGKTHRVCQDYARHGTVSGGKLYPVDPVFAIVSDGCSSCPDTDVGARMLTLAATRDFVERADFNYDTILNSAVATAAPLGLSPYSLSATLLTARVCGTRIIAEAVGDGVIAVKSRDGTVTVYDVDHNGAPKYLLYTIEGEAGNRRYHDMFPDPRRVRGYINGKEVNSMTVGDSEYISGWLWYTDEIELVMVMTDGVHSFVDAGFKRVPMIDVVSKLMDIRSYNGEFVERRLKHFLNKEAPKLGWIHSDDIGVAAIHIPSTQPKQQGPDENAGTDLDLVQV